MVIRKPNSILQALLLPNKFFFSSFVAFRNQTDSPTKVYCDMMTLPQINRPDKDGRNQENYKKQNKAKRKAQQPDVNGT